MQEQRCIQCGRTLKSEGPACSTGCDLARRLPMGDEVMPASWELGGALAWGFVLFNQLFFALADLRLLSTGKEELAAKFAIASLFTGVVAAGGSGFLAWIARPKGVSDGLALCVAVAAGIAVGKLADAWRGEALVVGFTAFNLLVAFWLTRGLWRGRASKLA